MTPTGRKPSEPQIQNLPGTLAYEMEMAEVRLNQHLASPAHKAQVERVKALSTELRKVLGELAERFGTTPEEMAKLIARRLERKAKADLQIVPRGTPEDS
jgi:uncharacterized coiled-coil DUF342 family protein